MQSDEESQEQIMQFGYPNTMNDLEKSSTDVDFLCVEVTTSRFGAGFRTSYWMGRAQTIVDGTRKRCQRSGISLGP